MPESEGLEQEVLRQLLEERSPLLLQIIAQLQEANALLRAEVAALKLRVAELEAQNRPPAAPFRRPPEQKKPGGGGRPGRKPGHPGVCRTLPAWIDEEAEVPLELPGRCPGCGTRQAWSQPAPCVQFIEDLPPVRPQVLKLTTWSAACTQCGHTLASPHPRQVSQAGGCAGVHLGARAQALAAALRHGCGLSLDKTARVLRELGGLSISRGGLVHLFGRMGRKLSPAQEALEDQLRAAPVVHADETSWWINGPASLWVFAARDLTLYRTVAHRDRATFHETLPPDWPGVLVSDCLSVYGGATPVQQKCYAHHLRALKAAAADCASDQWVSLVRKLLHQAMELHRQQEALSTRQRAARRRGLQVAAQALLEEPRSDPAEERLRLRLYKQRDHLFTFLQRDGVYPTNNLAERKLRPAVIARKLSCGHRTPHGAHTWATLASLVRTCARRGQAFPSFALPALLLNPLTPQQG
jgi:transposase